MAIDGSDLPAYANGQRYRYKNGPERKTHADPDPAWVHRSATSTRKGGGLPRVQDSRCRLHHDWAPARVEGADRLLC